jgi:hypothetical protein
MAEHTPAPWTRDAERDGRFRDETAGVRGPDGNFIAAAWDFNRTDRDAEVEANARLIAAAPEMLAALERLIEVVADIAAEQCDAGQNVAYWNRTTGGGWLAVKLAETAIAKAKGGAS